jgi:branched-chain amino acid aminotransferase
LQLVTAPLDDRLILDGVTRRSILTLAKERLASELDVVERRYTIDGGSCPFSATLLLLLTRRSADVLDAADEGRLVEAFAAGTAVSHRSP